MRCHLIRTCVAAVVWLGGATDGMSAGGPFTRGCAARDIQIMMMLEAGPIPSQKKSDAFRSVVEARNMCFDGHVADALKLYDHVADRIAAGWTLSGQDP
jgi:hypothetical protein